MKSIITLICTLTIFVSLCTTSNTATFNRELSRVARDVASLKLGFDGYILGDALSSDQKTDGMKQTVPKSLPGTYKFKAGDIYVIAAKENDIVLGMYKAYEDTGLEQLKKIIGGLMFEYGEPTLTAHDKMIYWKYNSDGKITRDTFNEARSQGGFEALVTIKFSSTQRIGQPADESAAGDQPSAYLMISSDPLSKLFLALSEEAEQ